MQSLHKFYFDAITRARNNGERYSEAMYNMLCQVRPDLAKRFCCDRFPESQITGNITVGKCNK